ncbi:5-oxoprolinase subunit PxpB [Ichthyenterobacterium sp. W332]|uniref:5-oxoprolinase subunit PxpB n=1 Tax=Microcosmobacter mediterraneus TaxID=3075607 RepID=A0ABU2YKT5_9FLAO|nr:5-oxoprolinase subunit PxpB [Ichthyenterobacterium sp. W332]MDT0558768.1 5-oxoprolinase subunit PxpB [Ichthyenterobacterium sp. W332]
MKYQLQYKPYNENSILIQWPSLIDENILSDILNFNQILRDNLFKKILYINNAYNSLLIVYKECEFNFKEEIKSMESLYSSSLNLSNFQYKLWEIPVCYDVSFGVDLELLSREKQMSINDMVSKHTSSLYTVYFIGFLPGFMYLGGLNSDLYFPRKASPRQYIAKGSVAIGGMQTGVYPTSSPGGWNIIGNTPILFFDVTKDSPCFVSAGDKIKFVAIDHNEHELITKQIASGSYKIKNHLYNG